MLIVGSSGTIGGSLTSFLSQEKVQLSLTTRHLSNVNENNPWVDLCQPPSTWQLKNFPVDVAIICAAVTSQKACEEDYAATYAINVTATVELTKRLVNMGTFVVFLSTNLVFDGTVPLVPSNHPVNPQTAYGQQKAEAEQTLLALAPDSVAIVRLSKVLNSGFPLFQSWIDALRAHRPIYPFADLYLAPISLPFATAVVAQVAYQRLSGIIQASAKNDLSYAEVAYRLAENLHLDPSLIHPVSCQTAGVTYAPRHTTLATDRIQELSMYPPDAKQVIDQLWMPAL